jgi:hypothetical protein
VQVQPEEKRKLPTDSGGYGCNMRQQPIDRQRIRKCGSEKIRQALDQDKSPWFRRPDDCRLCAEVTLDAWVRRIAELIIFRGLPPREARAQAEEEYALDPDQTGRSLRIKLNGFISEALNTGSWSKGPAWVGEVKHPIWNMVTDFELKNLFALIKFDPRSQQKIDEASLQEVAHEVIERFGQGARSIAAVLAYRSQGPKQANSQNAGEDRSTSQAPGSGKDEQSADAQPQPERSPAELQAIERILRLCAGHDPEGEASYRRALSRVQTDDLLDWNREPDENIPKVARLIYGDFKKGVREALRIVRCVIDERTPLSFLINHCIADGGRWEHIEGGFRIIVAKGDALDRIREIAADTAKYQLIRATLSDSELAGLSSLETGLLKRLLPCLLYDSRADDQEISFEESAI